MPTTTTKSRQELRSRFVRSAIPSEADFADLIGSSLNQADDGLLKLSDGSLALVRHNQKPEQPLLRLFADPAAEGAAWQFLLGTGEKPSLSLAAAGGKSALFVDGETGNVGVGTDNLAAKLHLAHTNQNPNGGTLILGPTNQSNLRLGYDQDYSWIQSHGSKPLSINAIGNNVGIGTAAPESKLHVAGGIKLERTLQLSGNQEIVFAENGQIRSLDNNHRLIFRRSEDKLELREYGDIILSSGSQDGTETAKLVLLANGNLGIGVKAPAGRLHLLEAIGTPAGPNAGSMLLDHGDPGGSSSIVFRSAVNRGSDYAYIEFTDTRKYKPRQSGITDWGYADRERGWYDIQGQGVRNDYCRWVGDAPNIYFSCALAGSSNQYTPRSMRIDQSLPHDAFNTANFSESAEACLLTIGIADDPDDYIYLKSSGGVKIDVLRLGEKFRLSGVGDHEANDSWLRLKNISNTEYYGGIAAKQFWTFAGQYLSSDITLKRDIAPIQGALECLLKMRGVWFSWKESCDNETEKTGLIAQEVEQVFPELVKMGPDHKLGVDYIGLIPVLIESIKSQQEQLMQLRSDYEKLAHLR